MHFLGKNLRFLRKRSAKTQSDIASLIKKGQTTVGNWENGISEPSIDELLLVSNYFDISLDMLVKIDLSEVHASAYPQNGASSHAYDHSAGEPSQVREVDDVLSFVLQEIRSLRTEMKDLRARMPGENAAHAADDKSPETPNSAPNTPGTLPNSGNPSIK